MKKVPAMIIQSVRVPVYGCRFVMMVGNDKTKLPAEVQMHLTEDNTIYAHAFVFHYKGIHSYGILINPESGRVTYGTIAHEALHCSLFLAEDHGFSDIMSDHEPTCYLTGYFTNTYIKFLQKHKLINLIKHGPN